MWYRMPTFPTSLLAGVSPNHRPFYWQYPEYSAHPEEPRKFPLYTDVEQAKLEGRLLKLEAKNTTLGVFYWRRDNVVPEDM